ncbi:hypothetical protein [Glycomyces sp. NRRL B-16210]|uniref:hypothetical protein n=1 Tax=Glycomyces sp. NRRL B-16210 TaxID=1463821 RepID=UPI0004C28101|nr:hypothetical protein [Glycomyces sp. NRRL B-16210]
MTQYRSKSKGRKHHDSGLELSIGQVLAAAGATTIGALLAKLLHLWGTVAGTAILSICSSIGAVLILRAMRRTGDTIKAQIAALSPTAQGEGTVVIRPDSVTATAPIPEPDQLHSTQDETVEMDVPDLEPEGHVTDTGSRKRTLLAILVSSVLVFGLTIGTLALIGTFTGDPGRFIQEGDTTTIILPSTETVEPTETTGEDPTGTETPSEAPTEDPGGSTAPTETSSPTGDAETPSDSPTAETGTGQGGTETSSAPSPETEDDALTESPTGTG